MNNKEIATPHFSAIHLLLTPKALMWLNGITQGIPHLTIFNHLLFSMAVTDDATKKHGRDVPLKPLEVDASANGLGNRWCLGRKVMERLLKEMGELGLVSLERSRLATIATMTSVLDYDAVAPTSDNPPSKQSQAEQQNVAQPCSDDGAEAAKPTVSTEAVCADDTSARKLTDDSSPQASVPTDGNGSSDTSYKPDGSPLTHAAPTLFDGIDEQTERP